jgi:hypothetical protein
MSADSASRRAFHGVAYLCPFCHVILGVGADPVALKAEGMSDVTKGGRRNPKVSGGATH